MSIENLLEGMKKQGWTAYRSHYKAKEDFPGLDFDLFFQLNSLENVKQVDPKMIGDGFVKGALKAIDWVSEAYPADSKVKPNPVTTSKNVISFAYPKNIPLGINVPNLDCSEKIPAKLSSVWFKKQIGKNGYKVFVNLDKENLETSKDNPAINELEALLKQNELSYKVKSVC